MASLRLPVIVARCLAKCQPSRGDCKRDLERSLHITISSLLYPLYLCIRNENIGISKDRRDELSYPLEIDLSLYGNIFKYLISFEAGRSLNNCF